MKTGEDIEAEVPVVESFSSMNTTKAESDESFEVRFGDGDDKEDLKNLSIWYKWLITVIISFTAFWITFISSSWSLASDNIMKHFHVGHVVSVLGLSLYVWGLGSGGIFLSPISENHGRKIVYTVSLVLVFAFECLTSFCSNLGGMMFGRFMSGFFGSVFMSVAAGSISDIFPKEHIKNPLLLFSVAPFIGPGLLPVVTGFINMHLYFRWTFHIMLIVTFVILLLIVIVIPETYGPVLLKKKAARLREQIDPRYLAPIEKSELTPFQSVMLSAKRPVQLMLKDYMIQALCFFTGFCQAIVYLFFVAIPYIFETLYHFNLQFQGLAFLGLVVGMALMTYLSSFIFDGWFRRLVKKNGGVVKPEYKFLPLIGGVFVVPVGLFIVAWTSYSHLHWMGPIIGSGIFGGGTILVFNGVFAYTVDAYRLYAATAMATNSFIRCTMAGVFPLFGLQMYKAMGIHWATTLMALVGCILIPIPIIFFKWGETLRRKSPFTWS